MARSTLRLLRGACWMLRHPIGARQHFKEQFGRFEGPSDGVIVAITVLCENKEYLDRLMTEMRSMEPQEDEAVPFSSAKRISTSVIWNDGTDIESALSQTPTALRTIAARAGVPFDEIVLESITARALDADTDITWIHELHHLAAEVRSPDVDISHELETVANELAEGLHQLFQEGRVDVSGQTAPRQAPENGQEA